ncbi:hypothetical protein OAU25_00295 [Crocinitomicaceae bacterium]|nr:hypothetical protein [Crocinitomicaceae bacterium]
MKKAFFIFCILILTACSQEYGNRVVGGNLSVHFTESKDETIASKLAVFWKENDLISETPQDIQLSRTNQGYRLSIIASNEFDPEQIRFKERKALLELRAMLENEVFLDKHFELVLSDNQFKPILHIK